MARIKGKWVGQVVINIDLYDVPDDGHIKGFDGLDGIIQDRAADAVNEFFKGVSRKGFFASTMAWKKHADLYRDEPSEWTKEEET